VAWLVAGESLEDRPGAPPCTGAIGGNIGVQNVFSNRCVRAINGPSARRFVFARAGIASPAGHEEKDHATGIRG